VDKQGLVWALDLRNGSTLWKLELPMSEHGHFMGAAAIANAMLLFTDFGAGGLQAVDRFTRTRVWRTVGLPCCVGGSGTPPVQGSTVFSASGDETVRALELATGVERWRTQSEGGFRARSVVCGGRLWAPNFALRAFDLATGRLAGVALDGTEEYASSGLATARGLVFVASQQRFNAFACN
jgi:outer membrane protein assembly factor BamB